MENVGTLIYTDNWDNRVYAATMQDASSTRVSVEVYVIYNDGKMSDIVSIPRQKIITQKNIFDIFFDFNASFSRDDIDKIKNGIMDLIRKDPCTGYFQSKATMAEIYNAVCEYITVNEESLKDNPEADVFIKGEHGYIATSRINDFTKENQRLGFKRVEILNRLKLMGALLPSKNRPYDTLVSINGNKRRFYKIVMPDQNDENATMEKEACETIDIKSI